MACLTRDWGLRQGVCSFRAGKLLRTGFSEGCSVLSSWPIVEFASWDWCLVELTSSCKTVVSWFALEACLVSDLVGQKWANEPSVAVCTGRIALAASSRVKLASWARGRENRSFEAVVPGPACLTVGGIGKGVSATVSARSAGCLEAITIRACNIVCGRAVVTGGALHRCCRSVWTVEACWACLAGPRVERPPCWLILANSTASRGRRACPTVEPWRAQKFFGGP